jgi:flavin reductase (DIM6/NTAB) family NADH-FMN oxidoreductase RutF
MVTQAFKEALASWASGVVVVSTRSEDLVYGLTVSSFTSLSLDPPLILICLAHTSRLPPMIERARRVAVSVLSSEQHEASATLAKSGRQPGAVLGVPEVTTERGLPVVAQALAHLDCDLHTSMPVGDHAIVVGHVVAANTYPELEPLVYHRRGYRRLLDR